MEFVELLLELFRDELLTVGIALGVGTGCAVGFTVVPATVGFSVRA